ncbi:Zn(2)-C6 fungal-type transcription factor [Pseudohyphozyma bogoriensis]|nr:Zn(2)-C6 fungal-type transcription factor [Pseudohyphozyma bogoriensis]
MPPDSTRSRSGCTTCRQRKKKCDEVFNEQGVCTRCHHGSFECIRFGKVYRKPRAPKQPKPPLPPSSQPATTSIALPPPPSTAAAPAVDTKPVAISLPLPPAPASLNPSILSIPVSPPLSLPSISLPLAPATSASATSALEQLVKAAQTPVVAASTSTHPISRPSALPLTPDPLSGDGLPSIQNVASEELMSFFESLENIGDTETSGAEVKSLWEAFPGFALVGQWDEEAQPSAGQGGSLAPPPKLKHCEKPEHIGTDCDCIGPSPLYANLNDDFYQSIPKPVRELVTAVTGDVAASHELTRAASMALVMIHRARSKTDGGGAEAQDKLIKQSGLYFQQAVAALEKTSSIPLEAQLIAMADMQIHQFDQAGASAAYAILRLGELFVTQALGERPPLDIATIQDPSHIGHWMFVWADVLRSVCLPRQRTIFKFIGAPGEVPSGPIAMNTSFGAVSQAYNTHLGLPVGLLLCFAAASNLSVDSAEGMDVELVRLKGAAIEEAIRSWKPEPPESGLDSIACVDTVVTQEMWRQATLIYLFQSVYKVGCLCQVVRLALQQILQLGARKITPPTSPEASLYAGSVRACPWFLAATVAVQEADRELCRQGLSGCGPQKAYADNLKAAERIWEVMDGAGWPVDWKEVTEREGLFVAFL